MAIGKVTQLFTSHVLGSFYFLITQKAHSEGKITKLILFHKSE